VVILLMLLVNLELLFSVKLTRRIKVQLDRSRLLSVRDHVRFFFCPSLIFTGNCVANGVSLDVGLVAWEIGLVVRSHLLRWFASSSGCPLHWRAVADTVHSVRPFLHRRRDGR
jgi:hypothetical protein